MRAKHECQISINCKDSECVDEVRTILGNWLRKNNCMYGITIIGSRVFTHCTIDTYYPDELKSALQELMPEETKVDIITKNIFYEHIGDMREDLVDVIKTLKVMESIVSELDNINPASSARFLVAQGLLSDILNVADEYITEYEEE